MMELITKSEVVKNIPKRWREQYPENDGDKFRIWKKLKLEKNLTAQKAEQIIGNNSWSDLRCNECDKSQLDMVVRVGAEPDYESATAWLCLDCVKKAFDLMKTQSEVSND
jgi:hypothetical protein